jgi:hypothetical protein
MITQAATGQATLIWIEPVLSSYPISGQNSEYESRIFSLKTRRRDEYVYLKSHIFSYI